MTMTMIPWSYPQAGTLYVAGSAEERAALEALLTPSLRRNLQLFVTPTPPDRLSLACMRPGGPLSDTNQNPTCGKKVAV